MKLDFPDAQIAIRSFRPGDEPTIIALWKNVFGYAAAHNDPATTLAKKLAVDPDLLFVATSHEELVGTAMAGYDGHRGWIYSLAVAPSHRRRGIARLLVKQIEQTLAARGCLKLNLQLLATNAATVAFYEKIGYAVEERISMGKVLPTE